MRTRMLLTASAVALAAASCAQPEPQVLSEPPQTTTATNLSSTTETSSPQSEAGRFIARCATEADGGTPGMTVFTDGSEGITDHCLSRYYIGVQPAPGALYVPHEDAGTYAPQRTTTEDAPTSRWTPAQPRTDAGPDRDEDRDRNDSLIESGDGDTDTTATSTPAPPPETPVEPTTPDESTTPDTTTPTDDGGTEPTESTDPDVTTDQTEPPATTTVPTVTETPSPTEDQTPSTAVTSTEVPTAEAQSAPATQGTPTQDGQQTGQGGSSPQQNPPAPAPGGVGSFPGSAGSHGLPFPFGSLPRPGAPTAVPTPGY